MKCPSCSADRPVDTLHWRMPSTCERCRHIGKEEDKKQMDRYKELYDLLMMQGSDEMPDISYDYLSSWCAGEMSSVYGVTDILYLSTCHHVHSLCMSHSLWSTAAVYGEVVLHGVRLYAGEHSRAAAASIVSLAVAVGMAGNLEKSKKLFLEADEIFKSVHGVEYPFYQQQLFRKYAEIAKQDIKFVKYNI